MSTIFENTDNSSTLANNLFSTLTAGVSIPAPPDFSDPKFEFNPNTSSDLYTTVSGATIAEVTAGEGTLEGEGTFDVFMKAMDKHLEREFKGNRITGAQYAEVYTAIANQVMGQAVSFTLQKDQARWAAITAQMQARIAEIEATKALVDLEKTKIEAGQANFQMNLVAAEYGLTKMKTATEEANHDSVVADVAIKQFQRQHQQPAELAITQYERTAVMPSTVAMNEVQIDRILPAQASIAEYQNRVLQPLEADLQVLQRDRIIPVAADIEEYKRDNMLPIELAQQQHILNHRQPAETNLVKEQYEVQRAQTLDTRSDGLTPVSGVVGLQKRNLISDDDIKSYNLANTLPRQVALVGEQIKLTTEQMETERANTMDTRSNGSTQIKGLVGLQKTGLDLDNDTKDYILANQIPKQVALVTSQVELTDEQTEAERAKTMDTRTNGAAVKGSVGKQKDLYTQQIDSFIKDAQHKTAKMYLDSWITRKTLDIGVPVPAQFSETNVSSVFQTVRNQNNL